ncbi:hypothetical protein ABW21_db0205723 [Orbilia brochopaga]|nr:hypothetical protein ABW21_db0205723 [Drechslerella brochopaga]
MPFRPGVGTFFTNVRTFITTLGFWRCKSTPAARPAWTTATSPRFETSSSLRIRGQDSIYSACRRCRDFARRMSECLNLFGCFLLFLDLDFLSLGFLALSFFLSFFLSLDFLWCFLFLVASTSVCSSLSFRSPSVSTMSFSSSSLSRLLLLCTFQYAFMTSSSWLPLTQLAFSAISVSSNLSESGPLEIISPARMR